MPDFRTKGRGENRKVYPVEQAQQERSSNSSEDKWIQEAINPGHEGRVREYLRRTYGPEAFTEKDTIKMEYLDKAIARTREDGNLSLQRALLLSKNLKEINSTR